MEDLDKSKRPQADGGSATKELSFLLAELR